MIVVPKGHIMLFLLGKDRSPDVFKRLTTRLIERNQAKSDEATSQELLLQICQSSLSARYKSDKRRDLYLGAIAVVAVRTCNAPLFTKIVQQTASGFDRDTYSTLGELICLENSVVSEDELVFTAVSPDCC